ncbi:MAG: DUF1801 domain-containing protein [Microthrixaceae bacterium]
MAGTVIDGYLDALDEPKRRTLRQLRAAILDLVPQAEECLSYGMPAFKVDGEVVAGFAAFTNHLSYLPHSGSVLSELADEVADYPTSKGALRFAVDEPLPSALVERLVTARLAAISGDRYPERRRRRPRLT